MLVKNYLKYNLKYFTTNFKNNNFKSFSSKFYKVTFSGLDKFLSGKELRNILNELNEVSIIRVNKSTNKNYGHADISTQLEDKQIKNKFDSIRILGRLVKVRVKEIQDEDSQLLLKENVFEYESINKLNHDQSAEYIIEYLNNFYIKNLTDNLTYVRQLSDNIKTNKEILFIHDYKRKFFDFEYKFNNIGLTKGKKGNKNKIDNLFIPIRTLSSFDSQLEYKPYTNVIETIGDKLCECIKNLDYKIFDEETKKGVYRALQIKFTPSTKKFLVSLMISMTELSKFDYLILKDALKYEFSSFKESNNISLYITINEKVNASISTSREFHHIFGNDHCLELEYSNKNVKLVKVYPFDDDKYNLFYLEEFSLNKIFNSENKFENLIDITSFNIPFSYLMEANVNNKYFVKQKQNFKIFDISGDEITVNEQINCEINGDNNFKNIQKLDELDNLFLSTSTLTNENVISINLRLGKVKVDKIISKIKYHLLFSNSFAQILDFIKNYSGSDIKFHKVIITKNTDHRVNEIILALEVLNSKK
jgi:hypothetical protein